jgi:hypothetical protein
MKRPVVLLVLCLLAGLLAWWRLHGIQATQEVAREMADPQATAKQADSVADAVSPPTAGTSSPPPSSGRPPTAEGPTGPRFKRAYILSLDQGALAYVDAQDIEGDFAPKRGREEVWSNMLRCRLMSESNAVLAEELLPAPDQVCQVLDPRSPDGKPVNFTNPGPTVFQVRLPRVKGARRLEIFRIQNPGPPVTESLLGSLNLP